MSVAACTLVATLTVPMIDAQSSRPFDTVYILLHIPYTLTLTDARVPSYNDTVIHYTLPSLLSLSQLQRFLELAKEGGKSLSLHGSSFTLSGEIPELVVRESTDITRRKVLERSGRSHVVSLGYLEV